MKSETGARKKGSTTNVTFDEIETGARTKSNITNVILSEIETCARTKNSTTNVKRYERFGREIKTDSRLTVTSAATLKNVTCIYCPDRTVKILRNSRPIMLNYPSADRNKDPILKVLQDNIPADTSGLVLEIASGSGQHVTHFSKYFQNLKWQPSETEDNCLKSITAYTTEYKLQNVLPPLKIEITQPIETWNCKELAKESCDIMYNANMVHISPWATSVGLFKAAGFLLKPNGRLFTYGPYAFHGQLSPESNVQFDQSLKQRDSSWGIRDVDDLQKLAEQNGLKLNSTVAMPANNHVLIFQKT